jgi:hypothetical protein
MNFTITVLAYRFVVKVSFLIIRKDMFFSDYVFST